MRPTHQPSTPIHLAVCACLAVGPVCGAHEFWIEPSQFRPGGGEVVEVALRVGEHFDGEPVVRKAERIERFAAFVVDEGSDSLVESPIGGSEGDEPAGRFTPERPGLTILVYDSANASIELEGGKFDAYLQEKGLDEIRRLRAGRHDTDKPARELYSRCAKSLILAGGAEAASSAGGDRAIGLPLEIVALFNPYATTDNPEARFRILYRTKPLEGVQVTARSGRDKQAVQRLRSNAAGEVTFRLADAGPWLIECTHMRSTPDRPDADYESFWASLTFESAKPSP